MHLRRQTKSLWNQGKRRVQEALAYLIKKTHFKQRQCLSTLQTSNQNKAAKSNNNSSSNTWRLKVCHLLWENLSQASLTIIMRLKHWHWIHWVRRQIWRSKLSKKASSSKKSTRAAVSSVHAKTASTLNCPITKHRRKKRRCKNSWVNRMILVL